MAGDWKDARKVDLGAQGWEPMEGGLTRQTVNGEKMTVTRYRFPPGARFPLHYHDQEQTALVVSGQVTFVVGDREIALGPEQMIIIAPNAPHYAVAGPEGAWVLSIVSPARQPGQGYTLGAPPTGPGPAPGGQGSA